MNLKKTKGFIKDRDMFGHAVKLNFNQKGDTHNTVIGGVGSILLNLVIYGFSAYKFWQMAALQNNSTGSGS